VSAEKKGWLDKKRSVDKLVWALAALCGLFLIAGFFAPTDHAHFAWERWFVFFALFGFAAYSFIVFAGKFWRKVVMREEDYYDR